ncbi:DNA gyrase subunit A [Streptomyces microflavus]
MRAGIVAVEEIGRDPCLVVAEFAYQTNPDNLAQKIADLVKDGKVGRITDVRDEHPRVRVSAWSSCSTATTIAKVVLNNLYRPTSRSNLGADVLALIDGVPRTLWIDAFIHHWVTHQIEVIVRRQGSGCAGGGTGAHPARPPGRRWTPSMRSSPSSSTATPWRSRVRA